MERIVLSTTDRLRSQILNHHPMSHDSPEQAAFLISSVEEGQGQTVVRGRELVCISGDQFDAHSRLGLELAEDVVPRLIRRAHELNGCLVEFHSHPFPSRARFSSFDLSHLAEFVPHVQWRLRCQPYVAVVLGPTTFDAIAWSADGIASPLDSWACGSSIRRPTGLGAEEWRRET